MLFYHTYKYREIELTFIVDLVINSLRLIILIYSFGFCAVISSVSDGVLFIHCQIFYILHLVFVLFQWLGHHRSWHPHLNLNLGDIFKTGYHELLS